MTATLPARSGGHGRRRVEAVLPAPLPHQQDVLLANERRKVLTAGRRWGKTKGAAVSCLAGHGRSRPGLPPPLRGALQGGKVWWVVPNYKLTGAARWREFKGWTRTCRTYKNDTEKLILFPGGGELQLKSADDPDSLRGEGLDGVVIEEASLMAEEAWTEALRPALSDRRGWAIFIFTPKGRSNWTFPLWCRGASEDELRHYDVDLAAQDPRRPGWRSWRRPSSEAPWMTDDDLADARLDLGSLLYAQEYDAEFILVAGGIFQQPWFRRYAFIAGGNEIVLDADTPIRVPTRTLTRFATIDLATSTKTAADYTVMATWGITPTRQLVLLDLWRERLEAPDIVPRVRASWLAHRHAYIAVESVAYQLSMVQTLRRTGLPIRELRAETDKVSRALTAAARVEGGDVFFPREAPWLSDFEAELLEFRGDLSHAHDDQVDALAYAVLEVAAADRRRLVTS